MAGLRARIGGPISDIGADAWNRLAGTDNPFMRYEFLAALESTGCTAGDSGWQPRHIAVYKDGPSAGETPVAVVPLYEKTNSSGEYVFDWSWAHAYHQHGLSYYPKFVTSAPFTPSVGRRFFMDEKQQPQQVMQLIRDTVQHEASRIGASSWHILFPTEEEHRQLNDLNLMPRNACQFHWRNRGYESFDAFLAALSSRKRKSIRRERARVREAGITFRWLEGTDISEALWRRFYGFYQSTYLMRGMQGYLSPDFFLELARSMPGQLLMICAYKSGSVEEPGSTVAAALFFKSRRSLFGRYWGCAEEHRFLHFETCFYQGQEYAIDHGLQLFDSGAQGEHKIQRGFEPVLTHSNHWIAHPAFHDAIAAFLTQESHHIRRYHHQAESLLPFRARQCP